VKRRTPDTRPARPPERTRLAGAVPFVLLFLAAAVLRIWTVIDLSRDWRVSDPVLDGRHYLDLAARLAGGGGWPPGPQFMTPLYPLLLSLVFRVAAPSVLTVQVAQSILGLATLLLLFLAARRDLGRSAAWSAAALALLAGPLLAMESQVLTESLLLFLAAAAVWLWPQPRSKGWSLVLFGGVCGLLTIGRGVFLLLLAAALGHLWIARGGWKRAALVLGGAAVALLPVTIAQTRVTGHLQFLTLNGGLNLYIGNNPAARGIYSAPPDIDLENDFTATRSASVAAGRPLNLEEASRFWTRRALTFMRDRPGRFLWLLGRKALLYFSPREIPQLENFQRQRASFPPLRVAFVDFAWIFPLALLGLVLRFRRGRDRPGSEPAPRLAPWILVCGVGWISTIAFFATGRYRIPFLAGFLGLAAVGLDGAWRWLRGRRLRPELAVLPAAVLLQWGLPGYPLKPALAHDATQHGGYLSRRREPAAALEAYRQALGFWREDGEAWHGLGVSLVQLGRPAEAVEAFQNACRLLPGSAVTHYNLGSVYGRLGRDAEALAEFETAVRLDPLDPRFGSDLAVALARTGRTKEALELLRGILRRDPGYLPARRTLEALGAAGAKE
jgi:tetratricopeptide (TPR) repeat protein